MFNAINLLVKAYIPTTKIDARIFTRREYLMAKWDNEKLEKDLDDKDQGYTQREWDRTVGIGVVPDEYAKRLNSYEEKLRRYDKG